MPKAKKPKIFDIQRCELNDQVIIPMSERKEKAATKNATVFVMLNNGFEGPNPIIDIVSTLEGDVSGEKMRFLGSVASREALESNPEGSILAGQIVGGYKLVVADLDNIKRTIIPGTIDPEQNIITRKIK